MSRSSSTRAVMAGVIGAIVVGAIVGLVSGLLGWPIWLRTTLVVVAIGGMGIVLRGRRTGTA